jgi:hypothetical protein
MNMRRGNILLPGETRIVVQSIPSLSATPTGHQFIDDQNVLHLLQAGGLNKIEHAAVEIAAANKDLHPDDCVKRARDVLMACHAFMSAAQQQQPVQP